MKLTMKLFLIISLFCTTALADGDMPTGDRNGNNGNGGGLACAECVVDNESKTRIKNFDNSEEGKVETSFISFIRNYFSKMLG